MAQLQTPDERLEQIDKALQKRGHKMRLSEYNELTKERKLIYKYFKS